jgi:hypothetical protein
MQEYAPTEPAADPPHGADVPEAEAPERDPAIRSDTPIRDTEATGR